MYRAYYWTVHSRYRPAFFNQVLPNNRILPISIVVFAYNNLSSLRNYTFSVYKRLVGHPYHATGPYIVQILKREIFKFCILDRIDEYHKRVCNILFLENRFNKYFFPLIKVYNEYFEIKRNWISRSRVIDLQGKIIRYFIQSYEISWQNVRRGIPRDVISNIGMAQVFPPCVQSPRWGWGACIIRVFEW